MRFVFLDKKNETNTHLKALFFVNYLNFEMRLS